LYQKGLTNDKLAEEIKCIIGEWVVDKEKSTEDNLVQKCIGTQPITCDSAEPKSIAELQQYGVSAYPARKGKDSVLHGIQWLQQQEIIIDPKCVNAIAEVSTYHWQEDANGNALPKPVDKDNHLIDAGRYAHEEDMQETWLVS